MLTLVTSALPISKNRNLMSDSQKVSKAKRSIELPEDLWAEIGRIATRTKRSSNGVIDAILSAVLFGEDVELRIPDGVRQRLQKDDQKIKKAG